MRCWQVFRLQAIRFALRIIIAYITTYYRILRTKLGIVRVPESTLNKQENVLTIRFHMRGKLYEHLVSYGRENMDDYDDISDDMLRANIYIKRDASVK